MGFIFRILAILIVACASEYTHAADQCGSGSGQPRCRALPAPGGIYDLDGREMCDWLVSGDWCDDAKYGDEAKKICKPNGYVGLYTADTKQYYETLDGADCLKVRIHELGHLWEDVCRKTIGENVGPDEEIRNLRGQLKNSRRTGMCADGGKHWKNVLVQNYEKDQELLKQSGFPCHRNIREWLRWKRRKSHPLIDFPVGGGMSSGNCGPQVRITGSNCSRAISTLATICEPCGPSGYDPQDMLDAAILLGSISYDQYLQGADEGGSWGAGRQILGGGGMLTAGGLGAGCASTVLAGCSELAIQSGSVGLVVACESGAAISGSFATVATGGGLCIVAGAGGYMLGTYIDQCGYNPFRYPAECIGSYLGSF